MALCRRLPVPVLLGLLLGVIAFELVGLAGAAHSQPAPDAAIVAPSDGPAPGAHAAPDPAHPSGDSHGGAHDHTAALKELLLALVIILVGAKLGGALFERLGQPSVLGEILVGILLGNLSLAGFQGLEFMRSNATIIALSELGVIILLFEVGLETSVAEMKKVGLSSMLVAVLGVVAPGALGWLCGRWLLPDHSPLLHAFIGATLCATSVGITARVLKDLGQLQRPEAKIVLGAAVIDDVLGLVVLAVVAGTISASLSGQALQVLDVLVIIGKAAGFLIGALVLGRALSPPVLKIANVLSVQHILLATSLAVCFILAWIAAQIGLAPIIGAFAAGLILDKVYYRDLTELGEHTIEELIHPISGFLVPVFFVVTGMSVNLGALGNGAAMGLAAALTVAAILGKQVCSLGVLEKGLDKLSVGIGMIPRGEVGLIFANIGLTLHVMGPGGKLEPVVDQTTFSAIVVVVMVTTLITPPLLKWSLSRSVS